MTQAYKHNRFNFSLSKSWILLPLPCPAPHSGDCFIWINITLENNLAQKKPKQIQELKIFILWMILKKKKIYRKEATWVNLALFKLFWKVGFHCTEMKHFRKLKIKRLTSPKFSFKRLSPSIWNQLDQFSLTVPTVLDPGIEQTQY